LELEAERVRWHVTRTILRERLKRAVGNEARILASTD
jgi:hypothetical protein